MGDGYNGWTNYETWNVALWIDNEQGTYADVRAMALEVCDEITETVYDWQNLTEARTSELAERIESYVEDLAEMTCPGVIEGASFVADIFRSALREVNYREIAGNLVEEYEETPEEVDA